MGFEHRPGRKFVFFKSPFATIVRGHERVLIVTQIHSSLSSKQHTITKKHEQKNMVTICCASTLGNDTTNSGLQHIAHVNNLLLATTWQHIKHRTKQSKLAHHSKLTNPCLPHDTSKIGSGNEAPLGFWPLGRFFLPP